MNRYDIHKSMQISKDKIWDIDAQMYKSLGINFINKSRTITTALSHSVLRVYLRIESVMRQNIIKDIKP
jgi:hypothetical protein